MRSNCTQETAFGLILAQATTVLGKSSRDYVFCPQFVDGTWTDLGVGIQ